MRDIKRLLVRKPKKKNQPAGKLKARRVLANKNKTKLKKGNLQQ